MTMQRRRAAAIISIALLVSASACTKSDDAKKTTTGTPGESGNVADQVDDATEDCPEGFDTAGIEGDTIKLISTYPTEGALSAFAEIARGYNAYFDKINTAGGVDIAGKKYKIEVEGLNDNYNSSETVDLIDESFGPEGTGAFGTFSLVGTTNNLAVRDTMNDLCIPNVFASSGSPTLGNPAYPWTIGSTLPLYSTEASAFAQYLKDEMPEAKVAMLLQVGEFGTGYETSFKQAIEGTKITVVGSERYEAGLAADVTAQVTNLEATGADVFFNGATLLTCPAALKKAAELNWKPLTYVSGTCASKTLVGGAGPAGEGALTASNVMDPNNPQWDADPRMIEFKETVLDFAKGQGLAADQAEAATTNGVVAYGWTLGELFVTALENAESATRTDIVKSLNTLTAEAPGLIYEGITLKTGENDRFLGEAAILSVYNSTDLYFKPLVEAPFDYEGGDAIPPALITAEG